MEYFGTVESKRSASEESSDCLLPNETSGTGRRVLSSVGSLAVGSLAVGSSVSGSSSATSIECATNAVSQSEDN